ncbi:MAG TPA: DUF4157 domain-containing protein, partial [Bryobacteraceae bacterium]|nr:DUF4157 domain-containing protein [Bryobacteraceae bacterium]
MHMFDRQSRSLPAGSLTSQAAPNRRKATSSSLGAGPQFDFARIAVMPSAVSDPAEVHEVARFGTSGPGGALPYLGAIQRSFGRHLVTTVQAHTDERSKESSRLMGANAFATAGHVAFAGPPSLRIAAHEAAHVIQQRAGISLPGGVGKAADRHERHANAVASRVVNGESSEALLDAYSGTTVPGQVVQRDEDRPATPRNDEYSGDKTGRLALPNTKFVSDPFAHTVLIVRPDGSGTQFRYETVKTEKDGERELLIDPKGEELEPIRVKALMKLNETGAEKTQETAAGSKARQDRDVEEHARWDAEHAKYLVVRAAYQEKVKALLPGEKVPPPPPPFRPRPGNTTMCPAWPPEVYHSAGGNQKQSFNFTPPKDLPGWHTFQVGKPGPKPGDIYWLWDIAEKRVAHMGVFKSATPIPGHKDLLRWVVSDGGQGTYTGIQLVKERSRTFNPQTGIFSTSNIPEAGQ